MLALVVALVLAVVLMVLSLAVLGIDTTAGQVVLVFAALFLLVPVRHALRSRRGTD